jgi:hypothetical protein
MRRYRKREPSRRANASIRAHLGRSRRAHARSARAALPRRDLAFVPDKKAKSPSQTKYASHASVWPSFHSSNDTLRRAPRGGSRRRG